MNVGHHKGTGIRAAKGQFVSPTLALKSSVQLNLAHAFAWENLTTWWLQFNVLPELKMEVALRCSEMSAHQSIHLRTISTIVPSLLHTLVRGHTFASFKDLNISTLTFP